MEDTVKPNGRRGYRRFWVAEHHSFPSSASPAPAVLLAHLAGLTSRIRLGSGGGMLSNHAPLVVAEQFGVLDTLHPGRIDLGMGRKPGGLDTVSQALRRPAEDPGPDVFEEQVQEVLGFLGPGSASPTTTPTAATRCTSCPPRPLMLNLARQGRQTSLPSPETAAAYPYTEEERISR